MGKGAVFFDCWDTLVYFNMEDKLWNIRPLMNHCINKEEVPWDAVFEYSEDFFHRYYRSGLLYEISIECIHRLLVDRFFIQLDCPVSECGHEVLQYLSPAPVKGAEEFLKQLEEDHIFYGVISNTIYDAKDTRDVLNRFLPGHDFTHVYASKDYGVKKPNPDFFQVALLQSGQKIEDSVFIGDAMYQDAYGSYISGFKNSIWLNHRQRDRVAEQEKHEETKSFPFVPVSGYDELLELYRNGKFWK